MYHGRHAFACRPVQIDEEVLNTTAFCSRSSTVSWVNSWLALGTERVERVFGLFLQVKAKA